MRGDAHEMRFPDLFRLCFDHEASDAEGLEIAKEGKLFLGHEYYVECWPFREISIKDGGAVELGVPAFTTDLTR